MKTRRCAFATVSTGKTGTLGRDYGPFAHQRLPSVSWSVSSYCHIQDTTDACPLASPDLHFPLQSVPHSITVLFVKHFCIYLRILSGSPAGLPSRISLGAFHKGSSPVTLTWMRPTAGFPRCPTYPAIQTLVTLYGNCRFMYLSLVLRGSCDNKTSHTCFNLWLTLRFPLCTLFISLGSFFFFFFFFFFFAPPPFFLAFFFFCSKKIFLSRPL